jgi:hypothetical protein
MTHGRIGSERGRQVDPDRIDQRWSVMIMLYCGL